MSDDDFSAGSIAAANAIIGYLRGKGHGAAANDVLMAWEDGTITGPGPVTIEAAPAPQQAARSVAQGMGYTGDQCDQCGSMKMQQTGHCKTCADCGTTTGCA